MFNLATPPILEELQSAQRILVAGAGGGFDIYCGLPLFFALREHGKDVVLANLTFANPAVEGAPAVVAGTFEVAAALEASDIYFPEKVLADWLLLQGIDQPIYCFERQGVVSLEEAYRHLAQKHEIEAIVLVDGGTDSLMRGDEVGLGTPHEDMLSIAAVYGLSSLRRYLMCLGFGVDAFHGVCHAHFLEAVAELSRSNAYLGAFSLLPTMSACAKYLEAVAYANRRTPLRPSIVNSSIAAALEGEYGDVHRTTRTRGSKLWINPLMSMYWSFRLPAVAERVLYMEDLRLTRRYEDIDACIRKCQRSVRLRRRVPIPV